MRGPKLGPVMPEITWHSPLVLDVPNMDSDRHRQQPVMGRGVGSVGAECKMKDRTAGLRLELLRAGLEIPAPDGAACVTPGEKCRPVTGDKTNRVPNSPARCVAAEVEAFCGFSTDHKWTIPSEQAIASDQAIRKKTAQVVDIAFE